jgi:hypothetical protein
MWSVIVWCRSNSRRDWRIRVIRLLTQNDRRSVVKAAAVRDRGLANLSQVRCRFQPAPVKSTSRGPTLLRLKQFTRHDAVDHSSQTVSLLADLCCDAVDVCMIAEGQRASKCEGRKFMHHRSNELILSVLQKESLQAVGSFELLLIEQQAGGINRRSR